MKLSLHGASTIRVEHTTLDISAYAGLPARQAYQTTFTIQVRPPTGANLDPKYWGEADVTIFWDTEEDFLRAQRNFPETGLMIQKRLESEDF